MSDTRDALGRTVSRRTFLITAALTGVGVAGSGALLDGCGDSISPGGSVSSAKLGGTVTWASWADPREAAQLEKYSADKQPKPAPGHLPGSSDTTQSCSASSPRVSPDAFYVRDILDATPIESNVLELH
jgi:multiple sugar transport system substrate-binding protein